MKNIKKFYFLFFIVSMFTLLPGSDTVQAAEFQHQEYTKFFVIHHNNASNELIFDLHKNIDQQFEDIVDRLKLSVYQNWAEDRINIHIDSDEAQFLKRYSKGDTSRRAHGYALINEKGIFTFMQDESVLLNHVIPHEAAHIIFRRSVSRYAKVPGWFEEGIASMQEQDRLESANRIVYEIIKEKGGIDIQALTTSNKLVLDHYYDIATSATHFLINSLNEEQINDFYNLLRGGLKFSHVLAKSSDGKFSTLDEFNQKWIDYVKSLEFKAMDTIMKPVGFRPYVFKVNSFSKILSKDK